MFFKSISHIAMRYKRELNILSILLSTLAIIIMFDNVPTIAGRWGGPETELAEFYLAIRYWASIAMLLTASTIQIILALSSKDS